MIDVKTLRIGNHIIVNGVKCEIIRLDIYEWANGKKRPHGAFKAIVNGAYRECGSFLDVEQIEPIPITDSLLSELGFEQIEEHGAMSLWEKNDARVGIIGERIIFSTDGAMMPVSCLHELENMYYHVFGKELVEG